MKSRVIVWRITQSCNMKCSFCSYSTQVERRRSDADEAEIKRLCGVLADYKRQSGEDIMVSWIGGEPFLWKNIMPFSEMLHDSDIAVSATTNGLLLNSNTRRRGVVNNFSEIVFSLDGFNECDDAVRQYFGHFDTVSQCIRALAKMRDEVCSPLKIKVNTILMKRNIAQFEEFCEYLLWLGVDELTFNQLGGFDRPEFYDDNRITPQQADALCKRIPVLQKNYAARGLIIRGGNKYLERIIKTSRNERNPVEECDPGAWFWFINENGFISPCSYTSYEYMYDTKKIQSAEDLVRVEEYFRKRRAEERSKWCDDCYCTQVYDKFA